MEKCTVVAKKELMYIWPFGLGAWLAGLIFIDRVNTEKARNTMNEAAEEIKKKNVSTNDFCVFIFVLLGGSTILWYFIVIYFLLLRFR